MNLISRTLLICSLILSFSCAQKIRKVHFSYPVEFLAPKISSNFEANVSTEKLTCFGNEDYHVPSYHEAFLCMLPYFRGLSCTSIWASRSMIFEISGAIEFLKLTKLPEEVERGEHIHFDAIRWMELDSPKGHSYLREVRQVPAEPLYLCARSTDWRGEQAHFKVSFRQAYLRERDRSRSNFKMLLHVALMIALSSVWLLPYVASLFIAGVTYVHGIHYIILLLSLCCTVLLLAPPMMTKRRRHVAWMYLHYFFSRRQQEEARSVVKERWPVFQALFFSSALVCLGCAASYLLYVYEGVDRETRNVLLCCCLSAGASWLTFFLCRYFERFFRDWVWVAMALALARVSEDHLNPHCRDKVLVANLFISLVVLKGVVWVLQLSAVDVFYQKIQSKTRRKIKGS